MRRLVKVYDLNAEEVDLQQDMPKFEGGMTRK